MSLSSSFIIEELAGQFPTCAETHNPGAVCISSSPHTALTATPSVYGQQCGTWVGVLMIFFGLLRGVLTFEIRQLAFCHSLLASSKSIDIFRILEPYNFFQLLS